MYSFMRLLRFPTSTCAPVIGFVPLIVLVKTHLRKVVLTGDSQDENSVGDSEVSTSVQRRNPGTIARSHGRRLVIPSSPMSIDDSALPTDLASAHALTIAHARRWVS